jgi:GTPase Era involved in 16S rRNA processing
MTELRILIFGSTGTGKTSLCNSLTGQARQATSSARGNTFETHTYAPFVHEGKLIHVTDTVGLDESEHGTVPAGDAIMHLIELLKSAEAGFNLLIHVFRAPRKSKNHDENYQFFVDNLTQGTIPAILVATGCENEEPMSAWAENNAAAFIADGCRYEKIIATCFASGGRLEAIYAPLRRESRAQVLDAIIAHSLPEPEKIYGDDAGSTMEQVLARVWNRFVEWAKLPRKYRMRLNESAYGLMIRVGVPKPLADAAVKHFPLLAHHVAKRFLPVGLAYVAGMLLSRLRK